MLIKLKSIFHIHFWYGSCWNKFGISSEQQCRCKKRRHRILGIGKNGPWLDGPNPIAENMRNQGVIKNY